MSDIPAFAYSLLWGERRLVSVANLTRADGEAFLAMAPTVPVRTVAVPYRLEDANGALESLRTGILTGAAVLTMERPSRYRRFLIWRKSDGRGRRMMGFP